MWGLGGVVMCRVGRGVEVWGRDSGDVFSGEICGFNGGGDVELFGVEVDVV